MKGRPPQLWSTEHVTERRCIHAMSRQCTGVALACSNECERCAREALERIVETRRKLAEITARRRT